MKDCMKEETWLELTDRVSKRFGLKVKWVEPKRPTKLSKDAKMLFLKDYLSGTNPPLSLAAHMARTILELNGELDIPSASTFRMWFKRDFLPYNRGIVILRREGVTALRKWLLTERRVA